MKAEGSVVRRTTAGVSVVLLCLALLTGCLGSVTAVEPTPVPTVTVTSSPTPVPAVTVTATPTPVVETTDPVAPVTEPVVEPDPEPVITQTTDSGPIPHATGKIELSTAGIPFRYTVAEGDIAVEICTRFNRWIWQLVGEDLQPLTDDSQIFPGDVIILTADPMPAGWTN